MGSVALRLTAPLLNVSISIVLVRLAGVYEYGVYSYCLSILGIFLSPITMGFSTLIVRNAAIHQARCEWTLLRGLLGRTIQWGLLVSMLLISIGLVIGGLYNEITPGSNNVFFVLLMLIPLVTFNEFHSACLRGLRHVILGQLSDQLIVPIATLFLTALVYFYIIDTTALTLVGLQILASLCAFFVVSSLLRSRLPPAIQSVKATYQDKFWLHGLLPLMILSGSQQIESEIVILLLGQFVSVESSGIYRICAKGAAVIPFVLFALNMATAPTFSRLYALGNSLELARLAAQTTRYAIYAALPITLLFVVVGDHVLHIFYGPDFVIGAYAMAILSIAKLFSVGTGPTSCLLNSTGYERDNLKTSLIALILTVILSLLLIPSFGLIGAAVASAISLMVRSAINAWFVFRRFGIYPWGRIAT